MSAPFSDRDAVYLERNELAAKFTAADRKLALIEVLAALWEAGAERMEKEAVADPAISRKEQNVQRAAFVKAEVARAHADSIRDILKEK